jgi:hypothetical protein
VDQPGGRGIEASGAAGSVRLNLDNVERLLTEAIIPSTYGADLRVAPLRAALHQGLGCGRRGDDSTQETGETCLPGTAMTVLVEYVIKYADEAERRFREFRASADLRPGEEVQRRRGWLARN